MRLPWPLPAAADTPADPALEVVTTTTTTADVDRRLVEAGAAATAPLVNRATAGPTRLSGANRYETSVAISRRAFADGDATTVYLVGGTRLDEALAGASLTDGPVLLVPTTGPVPRAVSAEIARLDPERVFALGGTESVSGAVLAAAAQGLPTSRLGTDDPTVTAVAIARRAFPQGAERVYLARAGGTPDAVVGGTLQDGPVLPVPATGAAPAAVRSLVSAWQPTSVVALGGSAAISAPTLASAASGRPTSRLAGAHRYATAQAVARAAYPRGATVAYLAGGTSVADAVVGGMLGDGPILLTPPANATTLAAGVAGTLTSLGVRHLGTLGGPGAVPEAAIGAVAAKVPSATTASLPTYRLPRTPAPTPVPTPPTDPEPEPAPRTTPPPVAAPAPNGTPPVPTSPETRRELTCAEAIESFRPVPRDPRYTIGCAPSLGSPDTLGLTETYLTRDTGEFVGGAVTIRSDLTGPLLEAVIAHELSHAWSYAHLDAATRERFARYVGVASWNGGDYDSMPAEVWARTQATCVGHPDGYGRRQVTCADLERFGWRP